MARRGSEQHTDRNNEIHKVRMENSIHKQHVSQQRCILPGERARCVANVVVVVVVVIVEATLVVNVDDFARCKIVQNANNKIKIHHQIYRTNYFHIPYLEVCAQ